MKDENARIVMLSLFNVVIPNGSLELFLDNSDSLWKAFDRYGEMRGVDTIQMFTVGTGLRLEAPITIRKGTTLFCFVPKRPLQVVRWLWQELRDVMIVHLNNESWSDFFAALIGKLRGARVVVFLHNNQDPSRGKLPGFLRSFFWRHVVDAFITNALETKKRFRRYVSVPVFLFPFGFDKTLFRPRRRKKSSLLNILFVGSIAPHKRVEDIAYAISLARTRTEILFHLVGVDPTPDGSYLKSLFQFMEEKEIHYHYWGFLPHSRLAEAYHAADLFVNMRPDEPFGKVFVEAMATGLPVAARAGAPGAELLIQDNVTGIKVRSAEELAAFFDRVVRNRKPLQTMGTRASTYVNEQFNEERSIQALAHAYDDLRAGFVAEKQFFDAQPFPLLRRIKRLLLNQRIDRCSHVLRDGVVMHKEQAALYDYCKGRGIHVGCGSNKTHPNAIGVDLTARGMRGAFGSQKDQYSVADIQASGDDLHMFRDGELDFVVARHNLEHYQDPIKALREWKRVVRRGGIIGIVIPDDTFCDTIHLDPTHYHVFTPGSFRTLVELIGGLKIEKLEPCIQDWSFVCILRKL